MKKVLAGAIALTASVISAHADDRIASRSFTWTGFYAGVNAGYGWGTGKNHLGPNSPAGTGGGNSIAGAIDNGIIPGIVRPGSRGAVGGLQAGYNFQSGRFVYGVEADFSGSGIDGSRTFVSSSNGVYLGMATSQQQKIDWFGTLRLRGGVAVAEPLLVYATAGLAYGRVRASTVTDVTGFCPTNAFCAAGDVSRVNTGWTVGGGAEYLFARQWSAKLEYLYMDLGRAGYTFVRPATPTWDYSAEASFRTHVLRVGLNYKFGS
jgi:outer membrane immunogenic protein